MNINYSTEEWKPLSIDDLDDNERYAISSFGRLKSFKTCPEGKIVKSTKVQGYEALVVRLKNNRSTTRYIHKLVAEHFIPKDSDHQKYVIHLDFKKQNNQISNLRWVTKTTMFAHQKINPNYTRGIISNSKLSENDVMRLKMKLSRGKNKLYLLASEFGITHTQLNRIRRGENWAHVRLAEN